MKLFVSYSRKDVRLVNKLVVQLEATYPQDMVWVDKNKLKGGDKWWQEIRSQIQSCTIFLYLMSNDSVQSEWCKKELLEAIQEDKVVIPVIIKKIEPAYPGNIGEDLADKLKDIQYVDICNGISKATIMARLWAAINDKSRNSNKALRIQLDRVQRLMLANQFEILAELKPDERNTYERMIEIVTCGYEWNYEDIASYIYDERYTMSREDCLFVVDVLDMYSVLGSAYETLKDKSGIEDWKLEFAGFDGNNETKYMNYAEFLVEKDGKFGWVISKDGFDKFNSHMPVIILYKKMLEEWNKSPSKYNLTRDDIIRILSAW